MTLQWYQSMALEPTKFIDDIFEFNKLINSYFDDMTKQLMQGFGLMANQLGGKLAAGGSSSSHHEEKKTYGETIFSRNGTHNRTREFKN